CVSVSFLRARPHLYRRVRRTEVSAAVRLPSAACSLLLVLVSSLFINTNNAPASDQLKNETVIAMNIRRFS
ncbi:MAG TPA: hypothetical protein P5075_12070, partial [Eubacteriales bacterium]|nr:hypothetical protein [Eubacteriales bacterium]